MQDPYNLEVTREAEKLVDMAYAFVVTLPPEERFGLSAQMRRSSGSIVDNIFEGCSRDGNAALLPFVQYSFGSARELANQSTRAKRLGLGDPALVRPLLNQAIRVKRKLEGLIQSLRAEVERDRKSKRRRKRP